jgi:hypothetical protein
MRYRITAAMFAVLVAGLTAADVTFKSTWKSMDAGTVQFTGRKVVAVIITQDDSLRVAGEEALARELGNRGMTGLASYRIIPKEEVRDPDKAKGWFERSGVEGVVALRPVSSKTERSYSADIWTTPAYSSLWGYYNYGWTSLPLSFSATDNTLVVVETLIFSVPKNQLLWAAVTESRNPKQMPSFMTDLANATVKEMKKQGIR